MSIPSIRERIVSWARRKSPWVLHLNSGACNACDIEVVAALTPRYDVERIGILCKGTPRHADLLVCTGPVTMQVKDRLTRIYEQVPQPKLVLAVGSCACSGGIFEGCYCVKGGIDSVVPVSAYVPGCPPRPEAIIDGILKVLSTLKPDVLGSCADGAADDRGSREGGRASVFRPR